MIFWCDLSLIFGWFFNVFFDVFRLLFGIIILCVLWRFGETKGSETQISKTIVEKQKVDFRNLEKQKEQTETRKLVDKYYVNDRKRIWKRTRRTRGSRKHMENYWLIPMGGQRGNGAELASAPSERSDWRCGYTCTQIDRGLTVTDGQVDRQTCFSCHASFRFLR